MDLGRDVKVCTDQSTSDGQLQSTTNKKEAARKRWRILAQVLRGGAVSEIVQSAVSVRRFQSFGLLSTEVLWEEPAIATWYLYSCIDLPGFQMKVRHLTGLITASQLNGFNNTGNVCVWPSEEVMTFYCMQHVEDFKDQRICELGGGMTCLAGLALAMYSQASHVELSDGNQESVDNLELILTKNDFGPTSVGARLLRWGDGPLEETLLASFDKVLCADCLFFEEGREALLDLIYDLLTPGGEALVFAPSRNNTFDKFAEIARRRLELSKEDQYDDRVWEIHTKLLHSSLDIYDPTLHFPLMMRLTKPSSPTMSRDSTPESR